MRFSPISPENMTAEQRALADSYRGSSWRAAIAQPDGRLGGPFDATLRSPDLAGRLAAVSNYFRTATQLPPRLNEFAILLIAQEWNSEFEWHTHCPSAIEAGLDLAKAQAVAQGRRPDGMLEDEECIHDFVSELLAKHKVSDAMFARAVAVLGERKVVDLVAVCGYYTLVAMMLATADVKPPAAMPAGMPALQGK